MDAPGAGADRIDGRSWPRWLLAWLAGVGGALVVYITTSYLAPQWTLPSLVVAWIGGALVMGGLGGANGVRQWLGVIVAEILGWIAAVVLIALVIVRLMFGPEAVG